MHDEVFHSLAALARNRAVRDWHFAPPALSFSSFRRPWVRSRCCPFGFDPKAPKTALHNKLAQRLGCLVNLVLTSGCFCSVLQPASSLLFNLHCFRAAVCAGAVLTSTASCNFGSAFNKPLLWLHNKAWLAELGGACSCSFRGNHFLAKGRFSQTSVADFESKCKPGAVEVFGVKPEPGASCALFSERLPLPLLRRIASGAAKVSQGWCGLLPLRLRFASVLGQKLGRELNDFDGEGEALLRAFFDDPEWIGELADFLNFEEIIRYRFERPGHINVLEVRAYKTLLKWCARRHPKSRFVGLFDSRVLLGASAKGRSSSPAITRILRSALPYALSCIQEACTCTPVRIEVMALLAGSQFRGLPRSSQFGCVTCKMVIHTGSMLLAPPRGLPSLLPGGCDCCCFWEATSNPGPRTLKPRGPLDLWSGFAASTQHKMRKALSGFEAWVEDRLGLSLEQALCNVEAAALALRGYGFYLYEQGFPRYLLVYAITAVQDIHPAYRSHLTPAWQVDKKWQAVEPGECRPVISQPIVCAAVSTSLLWEWYDWAAVTIIGFLCMMHPAEFVFLRRSDLVFPSDALSNDRIAYVHIRHPKTARFARRQHCRLEDPVALTFLESLYLRLPWDARLFRGSPHVYRSQWNAVMSRLQVPHTLHEKGATPGVLEQRFFI